MEHHRFDARAHSQWNTSTTPNTTYKTNKTTHRATLKIYQKTWTFVIIINITATILSLTSVVGVTVRHHRSCVDALDFLVCVAPTSSSSTFVVSHMEFVSVNNNKQNDGMLKVRQGPQRKPAGFQAQLICLTPWTTGSHPGQITSLCINSSYGL